MYRIADMPPWLEKLHSVWLYKSSAVPYGIHARISTANRRITLFPQCYPTVNTIQAPWAERMGLDRKQLGIGQVLLITCRELNIENPPTYLGGGGLIPLICIIHDMVTGNALCFEATPQLIQHLMADY